MTGSWFENEKLEAFGRVGKGVSRYEKRLMIKAERKRVAFVNREADIWLEHGDLVFELEQFAIDCRNRDDKLRRKLEKRYRQTVRHGIKSKSEASRKRAEKLLGCTIEYYHKYLEGLFEDGMSWENHASDGWHIDHKYPVSKFDMLNDDEVKACFHYSNTQPLWSKENISKRDRVRYKKPVLQKA